MTPEELAEKTVPCQPHSGRVMAFAHVVRQEVAAAIRAAVAEERERCARLAEDLFYDGCLHQEAIRGGVIIAAAIRKEP